MRIRVVGETLAALGEILTECHWDLTTILKYLLCGSQLCVAISLLHSQFLHNVCYGGPLGHLGVAKTTQLLRLRDMFFWLTMWHEVNDFIRQCFNCQMVKSIRPMLVCVLIFLYHIVHGQMFQWICDGSSSEP